MVLELGKNIATRNNSKLKSALVSAGNHNHSGSIQGNRMKNLLMPCFFILAAFVMPSGYAANETPTGEATDQETYREEDIIRRAEEFFGAGAEGLGEVISRVFEDQGRPNGYIRGEEGGGAIGVGVRYGQGTLILKDGTTRQVYWQGPSIGFDAGADIAKVFVLVYNLTDVENIFQRFPGVSGSLYFVAGVGVNYVQSGDIILAPIRFGVGWRQGVNIGYMHVTREQSWIPF